MIRKRIFNVWKANELETKYGLYVEGKGLAQYYNLRHIAEILDSSDRTFMKLHNGSSSYTIK